MTYILFISTLLSILFVWWQCFTDSGLINKLVNSILRRIEKHVPEEDVPSIKELMVQVRRLVGQKSLYGVWLDLVETHWDIVLDSQGNCYTFRHMREVRKCKEQTDEEVRDLALNYWIRNRFRMREAFVNWCYFMSKKAAMYELQKSADGTNMIPCFDDPVVNGRRSRFDVDVEWIDNHMPSYFQQRKTEWLKEHNLI